MSVVFMDCAAIPGGGLTGWRNERVMAQADVNGDVTSAAAKRQRLAVKLQAFVRMWIAQKRYVRHCKELKKDVSNLGTQREVSAALLMQKAVRVLFARRKLDVLRKEAERRKLGEDEGGKGKKGGKGKTAPVVAAIVASPAVDFTGMTPSQILLATNKAFVEGVVHYINGRLDVAVVGLTEAVRINPNDMTAHVILKKIAMKLSGQKTTQEGKDAAKKPAGEKKKKK